MSWIEITDVKDLQVGDVARFLIEGEPVTARMSESVTGGLRFAGHMIRYASGESGLYDDHFITAYREVKLPTERLSVIADVVTTNGGTFPFAVLTGSGDGYWVCFSGNGYMYQYEPHEIDSYQLAEVVANDQD